MSSTAVAPPHTTPAPVALRAVGRTFGRGDTGHTVLRDINLEIAAGEVVALLGPSGCGKSTLLRLIAGIDQPSVGEVRVDGHPVRGIEPRTAVVFQEPRLLPWRTLHRNVAFGLPPGRRDRAAEQAQVRRWLEVVGLTDFAGHRPRQVSGGMAQRAALARALARQPGVLLLDEPFAALDALTRLRMRDLVDDVQRATGATVLLVTHDVDEALQLADRIVLLGPDPAAPRTGSPLPTGAPLPIGSPLPTAAPLPIGSPLPTGSSFGAGSTIRLVTEVPGARPRDRHDPRLAAPRLDLLDRLGVPRRVSTTEEPA